MKEIYDYVERASAAIPNSPHKFEMMQEVAGRLIDSAQHYMREGKEQEDAVNKAIVEFGDLSEIRAAMSGELEQEDIEKSYQKHRQAMNRFWFSVIGSSLLILFFVFINVAYSRGVIWWVYPAFGIVWWPLSMFFFGAWRKGGR